jgi:AAA+ superfamily predicted ATPase
MRELLTKQSFVDDLDALCAVRRARALRGDADEIVSDGCTSSNCYEPTDLPTDSPALGA